MHTNNLRPLLVLRRYRFKYLNFDISASFFVGPKTATPFVKTPTEKGGFCTCKQPISSTYTDKKEKKNF